MSYELTGTVKHVGETEAFGSKGFTKREFVVTVPDGKYDQDIKLEFHKDNTDRLDPVREGDEVTVSFNLRGSEWKEKYYVNLVAWKLSVDNPSTRPKQELPPEPDIPTEPIPDSEMPF